MASTVSRPTPGMLNTVSVMTTPLMSSATPMPITVTIGTPAFFSAWRSSMAPAVAPFAAAVRI